MKIEIEIEEVTLKPVEPFIKEPYIVGTTNPTKTSSDYKKRCKIAIEAMKEDSILGPRSKYYIDTWRRCILEPIFNDSSVRYIKKVNW